MKRVAHILTLILAAAVSCAGVPEHRQAFVQAVGTNGVAAAKAAVDGIDWRDVRDPATELRTLKGMVEGRAGFGGIERELKTKLRLLTPGARMDGGDGTLAVPVAEVRVIAVMPVALPHLRVVRVPVEETDFPVIFLSGGPSLRITVTGGSGLFMPVAGVDGLYMPVLFAERIPMPVVSSRSAIADGIKGSCGAFVSERDIWAGRYGKLRRFRNADGTEFNPDWGTSLFDMRQEIESGEERYDALIDSYNERAARVLWRKKALKGEGVR